MREEDKDESAAAIRHNELRDIHHRIDTLKEENERQYSALLKEIHEVKLDVARGARFPAAAWVAAASLGAIIIGQGAVLYSKLEVTHRIAIEAASAMQNHVTEMGPAEQLVWKMDERVKNLEGRIVGQGPNGWHRQDHEQYAEMIRAQHEAFDFRLRTLEGRPLSNASRK